MPELVDQPLDLTTKPPLSSQTVAEAFQRIVAQKPDRIALRTKGDGVRFTWAQMGARVERIAAGLASLNVGHGSTVALLLPNSPECHIVDYAALHLGAVPFAIYNSSSAEQIVDQLRTADAEIIVTQQDFLPKVLHVVAQSGRLIRHVVVVDGESDDQLGTITLAQVEAKGSPDFDFEAIWRAIQPNDLVTLIFTSGTTGSPKAAAWSHHSVMEGQRALDAGIPVTTESVVSFLPLAHAGGRATVHYMALGYGSTITACPDISQAAAHFADARPDALLSVPRVFEKLQVGIEGLIEALPDEDQKNTIKKTIEVGIRIARASDTASGECVPESELATLTEAHRDGLPALAPVLDRLGLSRLKSAIVGGAPAAPELAQFFRAIGIPFIEAYGSSEASLCIFNAVDAYKTGSAGRPLPGAEVALGEDGELLIRSPFNFVGYLKRPEETAATLDSDGWLHSGDIAVIDELGYVTIVDRKKEIMINTAGKNMSPANIESAIRGESSVIGQIVAVGDGFKYVTALIALDPEAAQACAQRHGIDAATPEELSKCPAVLNEVALAVDRGNARLSRVEQVKKYVVLPNAWAPDSTELTPTGKLKRRPILGKYAEEIAHLYAN